MKKTKASTIKLSGLTISDSLKTMTAALQAAGSRSARLDSLILLEYVLRRPRANLLAHATHDYVTVAQAQKLEDLIARRLQGQPIAYIIGSVEFYGMNFIVNPAVLIPRPETESLVSYVIEFAPPGSQVLDIGTGSGAIAIAVQKQRPDLRITAADISTEALMLARQNAVKYSIDDISFIHSDLTDDIDGQFDVIVANLPYIDLDESVDRGAEHEPALALFSNEGGLGHYKRLITASAGSVLKRHGLLVLEASPHQHSALIEFARKHGFKTAVARNFESSPLLLTFQKQ